MAIEQGFAGFAGQNIKVVSDIEGFRGFASQKAINFIFNLKNSAGIFITDAKVTLTYGTTQEIINPTEAIVYERLLPFNTNITLQVEKVGYEYREIRFLILPNTIYTLNLELDRENCIANNPWNENNFLRWHEASFNLNTIERCPDICPEEGDNINFDSLNDEYFYAIPVLRGDEIDFQINTSLDLNIPVDQVRIGIVNCCKLVFNNVGNLFAPIGENGKYTGKVTIPVLDDGFYNLIIFNATNNRAIALSNPIEVINYQNRPTMMVMYRNNYNILDYDYTTNPDYYNQYRLDIRLHDPQTVEDTASYTDTNNNLITPKIVITKEKQMQTDVYFDPFAHDAMHFALRHSEFNINGRRYKMISGYDRSEEIGVNFSSASARLQDVAFTKNLTNCI